MKVWLSGLSDILTWSSKILKRVRKRNIIYIYIYTYIRKSKSHVLWPNTRRDNIIQSSGHGPRYVSKIYQKYTISRVWQSLRNNNWLVYRMSGWCNALPPSYGLWSGVLYSQPAVFCLLCFAPILYTSAYWTRGMMSDHIKVVCGKNECTVLMRFSISSISCFFVTMPTSQRGLAREMVLLVVGVRCSEESVNTP